MEWLIYLQTVRENQRRNSNHVSMKRNSYNSMISNRFSKIILKIRRKLQDLFKNQRIKRFTISPFTSKFL